VHFEGDSLIVVSALKNEEPCWIRFGQLVNDSKFLCQDFDLVTMGHYRRTANIAARTLAKFALSLRVNCAWLEESPPPIHSVILEENLLPL
jgi:hypothetical protein